MSSYCKEYSIKLKICYSYRTNHMVNNLGIAVHVLLPYLTAQWYSTILYSKKFPMYSSIIVVFREASIDRSLLPLSENWRVNLFLELYYFFVNSTVSIYRYTDNEDQVKYISKIISIDNQLYCYPTVQYNTIKLFTWYITVLYNILLFIFERNNNNSNTT